VRAEIPHDHEGAGRSVSEAEALILARKWGDRAGLAI
jgi:hypothetical protein